jgi:hypothetical protein
VKLLILIKNFMDFTLTGTALGLCGWNVYLLWKKFYSRKKESKIKSFIE